MAECILDLPKFFEHLRCIFLVIFRIQWYIIGSTLQQKKAQEGSVPWSLRSLGQLETHSMRLQYHVILQCTVTMYTNEILRSSLNTLVVNDHWSNPCSFLGQKSL